MSKRLEPLFFPVAFFVCTLVYLPALNGQPIWDDLAYWVYNPEMNYSFLKIWQEFSWPLSMSVQKIMLALFGENYWIDHALSLLLHFANSYLVYRLAKKLDWPRPHWLFLLFLFHPANVISVAWMIQIKTLLCFLFATLSFFAFERGLREKKWLAAAFILFGLSMLSKSASIVVPILFFFYAYKKIAERKWLYVIAALFSVFCSWEGEKLLTSPTTQNVAASHQSFDRIRTIAKTTRFYFWQSVLPLNTAPVKGRAPAELHALDFATPVILVAAVWTLGISSALPTLLSGMLLLIPFLGFVYAPFMAITWVSDQHLYLALPFLLAAWIFILNRVPTHFGTAILAVILFLFIGKTAATTPDFSNEDRFYRASLEADPGNVVMAFNYANTLAYHDRTDEAYKIATGLHERAEREPELKSAANYQDIEALRMKLIEFRNYKLNQH